MPRPLSIYILEESSIRGTELSAYTPQIKKGNLRRSLATYLTFEDEPQFRLGLQQVFQAMTREHNNIVMEDRTHLLILSSHGEELTGTSFSLDNGNTIDLNFFHDYFKVLPPNFVVFISACWGAYPAAIIAICDAGLPKPILTGPLVPISSSLCAQFQTRILEILRNQEDPEEPLIRVVKYFNQKYEKKYYQPVLRIVTRDGQWIPEMGVGGLANDIRKSIDSGDQIKYRVVALQGGTDPDELSIAILWDGNSFWTIPAYAVIEAFDAEDPYSVINQTVEVRAKPLKASVVPSNLNRLVIVTPPRKIDSVPQRLENYGLVYPHIQDRPENRTNGIEMEPESVEYACGRCNWATLSWRDYVQGRGLVAHAKCYRQACDEHVMRGRHIILAAR